MVMATFPRSQGAHGNMSLTWSRVVEEGASEGFQGFHPKLTKYCSFLCPVITLVGEA